MKKIASLLFLLSSLGSFAQSYTVLNETAGKHLLFTPFYDNKELFGYVELRTMNVDENDNNTIKYIVLDKNFNTVCTGDLTEKMAGHKRIKYANSVDFYCGKLRLNFMEKATNNNDYPNFNTYQVIDLKTNTLVSRGIYNPAVKSIDEKYDKYDYKNYDAVSINETGLLVQVADYGKRKLQYESSYENNGFDIQTSYYLVDSNDNKKWEYKNERTFKNYSYKSKVFSTNKDYIVLEGYFWKGTAEETKHLIVLDAKTGKELLFLPYTNNYTKKRDYSYLMDDKLYLGGRYTKQNKNNKFETEDVLGIFQIAIDLTTKETFQEKYIAYTELKDININKIGKIKGEGFLQFQARDTNPDGSFIMLAESYWILPGERKYTQLYTFSFDKDFNPIKTTEYEVKRTKGYKYSFNQHLTGKIGKAYYFFNKTDDKDLELNILNYYYKSKKQEIQKIPISNDESTINIFPAKEGYIGIAEYFKKPEEKGKYMEIRLEKLNYERE